MNWKGIFDSIHYGELIGASEEEIDIFLNSWNKKLNSEEISILIKNEVNPFHSAEIGGEMYYNWKPRQIEDFSKWQFPKYTFLKDYIDFLKFCNTGITTMAGNREIQFFTTHNLRQNNIDYEIPEYMFGAVSIGMDGSGNQIIFDMRHGNGEKLYGVHSSNLDWDEAKLIAVNFMELCRGTKSIDEIMED